MTRYTPRLEVEDDVQRLYTEFLDDLGYNPIREAIVPSGRNERIDILTDEYLIECKLKLTYDWAYRATGQLGYYDRYFPDRKWEVVVGFINDENAADRIREQGINLVEISTDEEFLDWFNEKYAPRFTPPPPPRFEYESDYEPTFRRSYSGRFDDVSILGGIAAVVVGGLLVLSAIVSVGDSGIGAQFEVDMPGNVNLYLRSEPNENSEFLEVLTDGEIVTAAENFRSNLENTPWLQVETDDGNIGYIFTPYISRIETFSSSIEPTELEESDRVNELFDNPESNDQPLRLRSPDPEKIAIVKPTVEGHNVNVRKGPGVNHEWLDVVKLNDEVIILENDPSLGWTKIKTPGGKIGYLSANQIVEK